jgi:biopolymer transport protein ExbD
MASVSMSSRGGRAPIVGINVTPLVDVVLVLLIIMMVSATYIVSQSLKVELPKTASSDETVSKVYVVIVTKDGKYFFNDASVSSEALKEKLRSVRAGGGDPSLVITADTAALHGQVVGVIDLAKVEGITKFAINVERSGE